MQPAPQLAMFALLLGSAPYTPRSGMVATDGTVAVAEEQTYGGLLLFDGGWQSGAPSLLDWDLGVDTRPLAAAVGLELLQGTVIVAAIERSAFPEFRGIRTWLIQDGTTIVHVADTPVATNGRIEQLNRAPGSSGTYVLSIAPASEGESFSLIKFRVSHTDGTIIEQPTLWIAGSEGRSAYDVVRSEGPIAVATPNFSVEPPLMQLEFYLLNTAIPQRFGRVHLPSGFEGRDMSNAGAGFYVSGPGLQFVDWSACDSNL